MKKILMASFDMEVGGVERSLISMLNNFDYTKYDIDLMLYCHKGDFLDLLPSKINLLEEFPEYTTFRKSIKEILREKQYQIALSRIFAKFKASIIGGKLGFTEPGYYQMQLIWKYALPFLPKLEKEYDIAISYLWPHYFIAEKVNAKKKIAWIHTDYSMVETDIQLDIKMWDKFDYIIAVSDACKSSFLKKYCDLKNKVIVIENITSPNFIRKMAKEYVVNPMVLDTRFKIVTVARLSYAKGIDNAVMALKLLKEKGYHNIAWYIVGYGGDEDSIKSLIKQEKLEDCFILLGKQKNPYPFIKEADIYIQPSRYEGKAVTVGEAQILSKPVLITNYTTAKSQVENGVDGYITDQSIDGIVKGIELFIGNQQFRSKLADNCKNTNYENVSELEKLYKIIEENLGGINGSKS